MKTLYPELCQWLGQVRVRTNRDVETDRALNKQLRLDHVWYTAFRSETRIRIRSLNHRSGR